MVNDPIGDMLIQIKNASLSRKKDIHLPFSRIKFEVAKILSKEGFIGDIEKEGDGPKSTLRIQIKYFENTPVITDLKRKSKPGLRIYVNHQQIPTVVGGMGIAILSTPQGIMTGKTARKQGIGGELLCEIW